MTITAVRHARSSSLLSTHRDAQQCVLELFRVFKSYVGQAEVPGGPLLSLSQVPDPVTVAKVSIFALEVLVANVLMVRPRTRRCPTRLLNHNTPTMSFDRCTECG